MTVEPSKQAPVIRRMEPGDLPAVAEAEAVCFPEDAWAESDFRELLAVPVTYCVVMEDDEGLAGYLVAGEIVDEGELYNIAVVPRARRRGLGRTLLAHWLDRLRQQNCSQVYLDVRENNLPAIALYELFGFQTVGRRRRYYPGGVDALTMMLSMRDESPGGDDNRD